jgi:polyisoprenoid-binding protein YceI
MSARRSASIAAVVALVPLAASAASENVADIPSGHYVLDPKHSSVIARVLHLGISVYAVRFDAVSATLDYDSAHPEAAKVQASVDPASLDAIPIPGNDPSKQFARDFLKVDQFPKASFVSTRLQQGQAGRGTMTGDLTLMGVTKPVTFDVTFVGTGHEPLPVPFGVHAAGFSAVTKISRADFGSTYLGNDNLVGDDVTLEINAEFDKR